MELTTTVIIIRHRKNSLFCPFEKTEHFDLCNIDSVFRLGDRFMCGLSMIQWVMAFCDNVIGELLQFQFEYLIIEVNVP